MHSENDHGPCLVGIELCSIRYSGQAVLVCNGPAENSKILFNGISSS